MEKNSLPPQQKRADEQRTDADDGEITILSEEDDRDQNGIMKAAEADDMVDRFKKD